MSRLFDRYVPVHVSGSVEFTVNRTRDSWVVGLINNHGVTKERMSPVRLDLSKKQAVTVSLKHGTARTASEWCSGQALKISQNSVTTEVPPGEVRITEFQL
jgi:hypothetical protein